MKLLAEITAAAAHLKAATALASDWRVRDALAGAGTAVACAHLLQQKIDGGKLACQPHPPALPVHSHD